MCVLFNCLFCLYIRIYVMPIYFGGGGPYETQQTKNSKHHHVYKKKTNKQIFDFFFLLFVWIIYLNFSSDKLGNLVGIFRRSFLTPSHHSMFGAHHALPHALYVYFVYPFIYLPIHNGIWWCSCIIIDTKYTILR